MQRKCRKIKKMSFILLLMLSLLWGNSLQGEAAELSSEDFPSFDLEEIVVAATKTERLLKDVPLSVSVINKEEIKKKNIQSIDQALKTVTGLHDNRGKGMATPSTGVTLRGAKALVMLDGQPINSASGGHSVVWSSIPIENVERIEVVKGAGSSLYGSLAMGGVINIVTKMPQKREGLISTQMGSYDSYITRLSFGDKVNDKLSYLLNSERKTSGGYRSQLAFISSPSSGAGTSGVTGWNQTITTNGANTYLVGDTGNNSWHEDILGLKLLYKFDSNRNLSFGFNHDKYNYGYDYEGSNNYLRLNGAPYLGNVDIGGGQRISVTDKTFLGLPGGGESNVYTLAYKDRSQGITFNAGLLEIVNRWSISTANSPAGGTGRMTNSPSQRWNADLQKELKVGEKDLLVVGMNYRYDDIHIQDHNLSNWLDTNSKTSLYSQTKGKAKNIAFFIQDEHQVNEKWNLILGARYDHWTSYDGMSLSSGVTFDYEKRSNSTVSPKLTLQYKADQTSNLYLSWGKSFNAPELNNLYRSSLSTSNPPAGSTASLTEGNPDLRPEKLTSIELGWKKQAGPKTNLSIAFYHNDITNLVYLRDMQGNKPGTTYYWKRYENAGKATTDGMELELNHKFNNMWSGLLNYTYQRAIIKENSANPASEGKFLQQAPEHILSVGIDYQKEKWSGNLLGKYVSKRYNTDTNTDVNSGVYGSWDPYFTVDATVKYQSSKDNTITLSIYNLLDKQYYNYYVTPGRNYMLQIDHKF